MKRSLSTGFLSWLNPPFTLWQYSIKQFYNWYFNTDNTDELNMKICILSHPAFHWDVYNDIVADYIENMYYWWRWLSVTSITIARCFDQHNNCTYYCKSFSLRSNWLLFSIECWSLEQMQIIKSIFLGKRLLHIQNTPFLTQALYTDLIGDQFMGGNK